MKGTAGRSVLKLTALVVCVAGSMLYVACTRETTNVAGAAQKPAAKRPANPRASAMPPTFYDVETFEPLPPAGVAARALQSPAEKSGPPQSFIAPATMPVPSPYRLVSAKPLSPPGRFERLIPTRERVVAVGRENLRILNPALEGLNDFQAPAGLRVDAARDLILMADVLGSVVGRRTRDLSIALRLNPTFPRGYERWVLFADGTSMLVASVELQQMVSKFTHVPDITMFEWWTLGDLAKVDPTSSVPPGAEVKAVTYTRTRPLLFAAQPQSGDPLLLAQPGHLLWLNRALQLTADVALPAGATPLALEVGPGGRALLALRADGTTRFWIVEPGGQQLCDVALPEAPGDRDVPVIVPGPGVVYLVAGSTVTCVDEAGVARWRSELPSAPVAAGIPGREGGLFATSGRRLYRIDAGGRVDVLFEAGEPLVSIPLQRDAQVLVATMNEILTLVPAR